MNMKIYAMACTIACIIGLLGGTAMGLVYSNYMFSKTVIGALEGIKIENLDVSIEINESKLIEKAEELRQRQTTFIYWGECRLDRVNENGHTIFNSSKRYEGTIDDKEIKRLLLECGNHSTDSFVNIRWDGN